MGRERPADTGAARLAEIRERLNAWREMDILAGKHRSGGPDELFCHCPFCELTTHASGDLAVLLAEIDGLRAIVSSLQRGDGSGEPPAAERALPERAAKICDALAETWDGCAPAALPGQEQPAREMAEGARRCAVEIRALLCQEVA